MSDRQVAPGEHGGGESGREPLVAVCREPGAAGGGTHGGLLRAESNRRAGGAGEGEHRPCWKLGLSVSITYVIFPSVVGTAFIVLLVFIFTFTLFS